MFDIGTDSGPQASGAGEYSPSPGPRQRPAGSRRLLRARVPAGAAGLAAAALAVIVAAVGLAVGRPGGRAQGRVASKVRAVPASVASDCSRPVDAELNRFFAAVPDGATIRFAPGGCYGLDDSLWVTDRHGLTFDGAGATFRIVTSGRNTTYYRSDWRVRRGSGLTFLDMEVVGACGPGQCRNGAPPPELDGYGQHGFNLESAADVVLKRVYVHDVLSDGVEAQGTLDPNRGWDGEPTRNLTVTDSRIERAGRMLVGITDLDGGTLSGNHIADGPEVGIDVEVDVAGFVARHISVVDNTFENIHAQAFSNGGLGSDPLVGDIRIEDNVMASAACAGSIYIRSPGPTDPPVYRSGYVVRGNRFSLIGWFLQAERVKDLTLQDNVVAYSPVGCGEKAAVELIDSPPASLTGNDFTGYPAPTSS
jgi:hypothetical protein